MNTEKDKVLNRALPSPFSKDKDELIEVYKILNDRNYYNKIRTFTHDFYVYNATADRFMCWLNTFSAPELNLVVGDICRYNCSKVKTRFRVRVTGSKDDMDFWRESLDRIAAFFQKEEHPEEEYDPFISYDQYVENLHKQFN